MQLARQIAKHFREVYFGGNWTSVNFKEVLADVSWQQATTKLYSLNTIAILVFHTSYYIEAVMSVLKGEPLQAKDKYSFDLPPIETQEAWEALLAKTWREAEEFATRIEQMDDDQLDEIFADEKYGTYYRNLHGVIEHAHYHLGQIVLLKKLLQESKPE